MSAGAVDTNIVITFTTNEFAYGPVKNEENDGESNDTGTDYPELSAELVGTTYEIEFTPDTNVITPNYFVYRWNVKQSHAAGAYKIFVNLSDAVGNTYENFLADPELRLR